MTFLEQEEGMLKERWELRLRPPGGSFLSSLGSQCFSHTPTFLDTGTGMSSSFMMFGTVPVGS